jgi:hypothetical protein
MAQITKTLNETLASRPDDIPIVLEGIRFCADVAMKNRTEILATVNSSRIDGLTICEPFAGYLMKCVFAHKLAKCSPNYYDWDNERCVMMRQHFQKCPIPKF